MILSKVERLKDKRRFDIYIDDAPALRVHDEIIIKFGLRAGNSITEEFLDELRSAEEFVLAKEKALAILGRRIRSERELRSMLRMKEFHPLIIDKVIAYLRDSGFLDDERFARIYANHILSRKPAGRALLQRELTLKGVRPTLVNNVVKETLHDDDELRLAFTAARQLLKRQAFSKKNLDAKKKQHKLASYLASRGFAWSTISKVIKAVAGDNVDIYSERSDEDSPEAIQTGRA